MTDPLLLRAVLAAPLVVLLPVAVPALEARPVRGVFALALLAAACAPALDSLRGWLVVLVGTLAALAISRPGRHAGSAVLVAACSVAAVAVVADAAATGDALRDLRDSAHVVVLVAGALTSTLLAGELVARVLDRAGLAHADVPDAPRAVEHAGRIIGWLERLLVFILVVGGVPEVAGLVVAAKSIARFPAFRDERFAELYLVGTLLSIALAVGVGVGARLLLGLTPL